MDRAGAVRIGFIGCGGVAEFHAKGVRKCDAATLTAVYDVRESLARQKASEWGAQFRTPEHIFQSDDVDAVYVLTPMEHHLQYAREALLHEKHVLIEKPVSLDLEGIAEIIKIGRSVGKVCFPGHSYLYLPELKRMRQLVGEGKIGVPTAMFMSEIYRMPDEQVRRYHGPSIEVLCHQIYLMLTLLGRPQRVQALAGSFREELFPDGDEQVAVNAQFADGKLAHLFVSWANHDETSDPWTFKVKVWGTEGGMHFSRRDQVRGTTEEMRDYPLYGEMFERETEHFVKGCLLNGEAPLSTMDDALDTMIIASAIRRSFINHTVETLDYESVRKRVIS
jgi:predicted dehydrogenase